MRREAQLAHNERSGEGMGVWEVCKEEEEMRGEISDEAKRTGRRSHSTEPVLKRPLKIIFPHLSPGGLHNAELEIICKATSSQQKR